MKINYAFIFTLLKHVNVGFFLHFLPHTLGKDHLSLDPKFHATDSQLLKIYKGQHILI